MMVKSFKDKIQKYN